MNGITSLLLVLAPFASEPVAARADAVRPVAASDERAELARWRLELLDLAHGAASAFPLKPHVKNRSRAQADVVAAALEVDRPDLALRYAREIQNWRRGEALAAIAQHQAERGRTQDVESLLDEARRIADAGGVVSADPLPSDGIETSQEWRVDRIRARIASTYVILGRNNLADSAAFGVVDAERVPVHAARAGTIAEEGFEEHMKRLDGFVATGTFDSLRGALASYARLFERFYDDVPRRAAIESKIHAAWEKMPVQVKIEVQEELVATATRQGDREKALQLLDDANTMLSGLAANAEAGVPLRARLAKLRALAGDAEKARAEADAALFVYEGGRDKVVNIYRAGVLRPVAEAYAAIGDVAKARSVYARALEEGVANPNSRPRADDLVATACSLVVSGTEPDEALQKRMREIRAGLGDPW